jgi:adhesin transport system outer membrane protein
LPTLAPLIKAMPVSAEEAMNAAVQQSPAVSASIESLRATRSSADARRSVFQPRVEARVRSGAGNNFDGIRDQRRDSTAEIALNWNLYNGGGDAAHLRQQVNLISQAADQRDKTCRDTRQVSAIAFNDTRKLIDQLQMLDRNTLAIEKARDAYRQQFDIGQRSLLDLLNAENEVYTARRSYANAEYDLGIAYARTHAAMNQLTTQVGVARVDPSVTDATGWSAGEDAPGRCPIISSEVPVVDRAVLDERARQIAATVAPAARPLPVAPTTSTPAQPASPVAAPASAASQPAKKIKKVKKLPSAS